jgi:ATP-binding cassette subfamily B protein
VRRLISGQVGALALAAALLSLQAAGVVLGPYLAREAVDRGILTGSLPGLVNAAAAIAGLGLGGLLLSAGTVLLTGRVGQRVVRGLRIRVWAHLVRLPVFFYERQRAGRLLTNMVNDIDAYSDLVSDGLATAVVSLLTLVGVLVGMTAVSPPLAGVTVAVVLPFVFILWRFNRTMTAAYGQARGQMAAANAVLQENLAGLREAQAFGQQRRQHAEYARHTRRYLDSRLSAEKLVALAFPITTFLSSLAVALVLGLGARLLRAGSLSPGELIAFVLWINIFFGPLLQLSLVYSGWKRVRVSTVRINSLMAQPLEERARPVAIHPGSAAGPAVRGEVRLCGVRFRYPDTTVDALRGVDLTVLPGETLAIVGPTGAGKSTLLKLLARFYPAAGGRILLDGHDVRRLDLAGYRRILGYLPQEPYLFPGTVQDNIAYGRPNASDVDVEHAARAVGAHDAIAALGRGYRQEVGERGASLSAGQRQLVCLARAYLLDPAIVLLDEATTHLDLATEAQVLSALRAVTRGRTTVMIAHRMATAMAADRIAVVDNGHVVAVDTAAALLDAGGLFAELHEASRGHISA